MDREAFAGELVDHVEHLDRASVGEGVKLEVEHPEHVRADRTHRPDMHANTRQSLLAFLGRDTESFFAPQPANTLVVDLAKPFDLILGDTVVRTAVDSVDSTILTT